MKRFVVSVELIEDSIFTGYKDFYIVARDLYTAFTTVKNIFTKVSHIYEVPYFTTGDQNTLQLYEFYLDFLGVSKQVNVLAQTDKEAFELIFLNCGRDVTITKFYNLDQELSVWETIQ